MDSPAFLKSIAAYYAAGVPGRTPHQNVVYVLPNKRSAVFLKRHVQIATTAPSRMPRIKTMGALMADFSGMPEANRRELLFILYRSYRQALAEAGRASAPSFDSFAFLGMLLLDDFDEIDRSLADTGQLFRNLRELRDIQADYLEPEQKEVIRRIWGDSPMTAEGERFWLHLPGAGDDDGAHRHLNEFVSLWDVLAKVYRIYHRTLADSGMAASGAQFRMAWEFIKNAGENDLDPDAHYVFVGFNDFSKAEALILKRLQRLGKASFFWDTAAMRLVDDDACPQALRLLGRLCREFPMPEDYECPVPEHMPRITVVAVPSNIAQTKVAASTLEQWRSDRQLNPSNPLNTAVVLPDRAMLMPMLFSIPDSLRTVNVTMQMDFRSTSFATLLQAIVRMQMQARSLGGRTHYYYEHVAAVFNHPHIRTIAREQADAVLEKIRKENIFNIDALVFAEEFEVFRAILTPVSAIEGVGETARYIVGILDSITDMMIARTGHETFETAVTARIAAEVKAMAALAQKYGVEMRADTFMRMFERVVNTAGIPLEGTPLQGLQILGVLESRALDFDNVAVLSMNDGVFPRKQYANTLIPNNLRHAFGLPDAESLELTYAYSFYRLLARAHNVLLLYDARTNGRNAEPSRYISQLKYLMPGVSITETSVTLAGAASGERTIVIEKTGEVLRRINDFRAGGPLSLSATALKSYIHCPLQFYILYAARQRGSEDPVDNITTAQYGTLVHNVIQALFVPMKGKLVDAAFYDRLLRKGNSEIRRTVVAMLADMKNRGVSDFTGEMEVAADLIEQIVRNDLEAERNYYCAGGEAFIFVDKEMESPAPVWEIEPGLSINWKMAIDRVDRTDADTLRFIDIKTGADSTVVHSLPEILTRSRNPNDAVFQLFTYCQAYTDIMSALGKTPGDIEPVVQTTRSYFSSPFVEPITLGKTAVKRYSQVRDEFEPLLKGLLHEIFDPAVPFTQCEHSRTCNYCRFRSVCGRGLYEY